MRRLLKAPKYVSLFLLIALAFIACDQEYNSIDSEVLGEENTNFNTTKAVFQILSYNKKLESLQINNLGSSLLGFYNDPIYGQTTASLITQVTPAISDPDFGANVVIDSVILNIPYFSRATGEVNLEGTALYTLNDSIFGSEDTPEDEPKVTPIKLTIYRNNHFLSDFDPYAETNTTQNYYSNPSNVDKANNYAITENSLINFDSGTNKGEVIYETNNFKPSHKAVVLSTGTEADGDIAKTVSAPAFRIDLADNADKKAYWSSLILEKQGDLALSSPNDFKKYFRGLYFKAEAIDNNGQMILLNTNSSNSRIIIYYSKDSTIEGERTQAAYALNLTGNRVNPYINTHSPSLQDGDRVAGDEKLYLKGTGSIAIVDLFNGLVTCEESNTEETALDCFKKTYRQLNEDGYILKSGEEVSEDGFYIIKNGDFVLKRLINEAQLIIYEDDDIINSDDLKDAHKYDRIYAYDIENNLPTSDYLVDRTDNSSNPKFSKFISLGQRTTNEAGISKYKIRITEHLKNILVRDSTNTKLGLVLSNNVNITSNSDILESNDIVTGTPSAAILSPRGTVLHGHHASDPEKSISLEVYLTEQKK